MATTTTSPPESKNIWSENLPLSSAVYTFQVRVPSDDNVEYRSPLYGSRDWSFGIKASSRITYSSYGIGKKHTSYSSTTRSVHLTFYPEPSSSTSTVVNHGLRRHSEATVHAAVVSSLGSSSELSPAQTFTVNFNESGHAQPLGTYEFSPSATACCKITVTFPSGHVNYTNVAMAELLASFRSGRDLIDTKFYLFTRRSGSTASHPRAIFANRQLLSGHSPYLNTCRFHLGS